MFHGPVLTHARLDDLYAMTQIGKLDCIKVVTAWGLVEGWNSTTRARVCAATDHTIVRTAVGDPASGRSVFLHTEEVVQEIAPWYAIKPHIWIELGNEPNVRSLSESEIHGWAWHLDRTITEIRKQMPYARIISPAMLMTSHGVRTTYREALWLEIAAAAIRRCDAVGVHVYEYDSLVVNYPGPRTRQADDALALHLKYFADKPWVLSEYGINNPKIPTAQKIREYIEWTRQYARGNVIGATFFHVNYGAAQDKNYPEYHIAHTDVQVFAVR